MSKVIRWGIIGCGNVTEVKSGPALQQARGSALVAVMRRDAAKAAEYAKRHNVARWYTDADKLIADPEVDAVYIATPPGSHCEYTLRAARAGKPVYVEKPMARTHDECQQMIGACASAGVPLFVAYYRRGLERFLKVKGLIESGAVGDVRFVSTTLYYPPEKHDGDPANRPWRVIPELAGAGRFLDLASHTLDILDFILGPITSVAGRASNQAGLYDAEDIVAASWTHASGTQGVGLWCFTAGASCEMNEIVGSAGRLRFSTFGSEPLRLERSGKIEEFAIENPVHIQQPLIQTIVDQLHAGPACPSTGVNAARTSWVMDRILDDYRARRRT